jgi:hypothetical protein
MAFFMALKRLPMALAGRKIEKAAVRFSDREILERINANRSNINPNG